MAFSLKFLPLVKWISSCILGVKSACRWLVSRRSKQIAQTTSTILAKLPTEIRISIWSLAIGKNYFHVTARDGMQRCRVCDPTIWKNMLLDNCAVDRNEEERITDYVNKSKTGNNDTEGHYDISSLLLVCRQM
ncbi:hypothetical protein BCR34DRAFT_201887 [Clohesyomyces aquaticus]|uniref:DUF7730 domain-containing protein n=1 Tax=Clohesyomyces aquaticus TaxID=1231657 RepID=A0A1Y1ZXH6_9PLEO|nr:hypothetical protein BCR34DRAFT_201887 [Clohesyomyces aquaticus]